MKLPALHASWGQVSLRTKIMMALMGLVSLIGIPAVTHVENDLQTTLQHQLERRGIAIAKEIAANAVEPSLSGDDFALFELVNRALAVNDEVRYAFIVEPSGLVRVHTFERGVPPDLLDVNTLEPGEGYRVQILKTNEGYVRDVAVPIFEGAAGIVHVGLTETALRGQIASHTRTLSLLGVGIGLFSVVVSFLLATLLTRPIMQLVEVARAIRGGDLTRSAAMQTTGEVGQLGQAFSMMTEEIMQSREELLRQNEELQRRQEERGQLLQEIINAQESERRRVARELHDEAGQALSAVIMSLDRVARSLPPTNESERQVVERGKSIVRRALDEVNATIMRLRPPLLDDLGLMPALQWYVEERFGSEAVMVDFLTEGLDNCRLPADIEIAVYRVVQEAVNNVFKHAGASSIKVRLGADGSVVRGSVEDDGRGFVVRSAAARGEEGRGFGLLGMRERVTQIGGSFSVQSRRGKGTTVRFEIPLPGEAQQG